ncbi:hypothetical protein D3C73_1015690 [compost metagenome]
MDSPLDNGTHVSKTKISKDIVVRQSMLFPGVKLISLAIASMKLCTAWWVIMTPFGFPVDPDVYMTYAL